MHAYGTESGGRTRSIWAGDEGEGMGGGMVFGRLVVGAPVGPAVDHEQLLFDYFTGEEEDVQHNGGAERRTYIMIMKQ